MTEPVRRPANASPDTAGHGDRAGSAPVPGLEGVAVLLRTARAGSGDAHALSPAHARHVNARRAGYAAAALGHHVHVSDSRPDSLKTAITELLTDIHHLFDTCDVDTDLATLFKVAAVIHTRETQPS